MITIHYIWYGKTLCIPNRRVCHLPYVPCHLAVGPLPPSVRGTCHHAITQFTVCSVYSISAYRKGGGYPECPSLPQSCGSIQPVGVRVSDKKQYNSSGSITSTDLLFMSRYARRQGPGYVTLKFTIAIHGQSALEKKVAL